MKTSSHIWGALGRLTAVELLSWTLRNDEGFRNEEGGVGVERRKGRSGKKSFGIKYLGRGQGQFGQAGIVIRRQGLGSGGVFGGEGTGGQGEGKVTQAGWAQIMKDMKGHKQPGTLSVSLNNRELLMDLRQRSHLIVSALEG